MSRTPLDKLRNLRRDSLLAQLYAERERERTKALGCAHKMAMLGLKASEQVARRALQKSEKEETVKTTHQITLFNQLVCQIDVSQKWEEISQRDSVFTDELIDHHKIIKQTDAAIAESQAARHAAEKIMEVLEQQKQGLFFRGTVAWTRGHHCTKKPAVPVTRHPGL